MIRKFNRYELKYILTHHEHMRLVRDLEKFLEPDKYAKENGTYKISSLYYDSPDLSCFWNKIDGIKYRRKLRLRVYHGSDMSLGFVEIKQRINRTVQKRRMCLPFEQAQALCRGDEIGLADFDDTDRETASEVLYLVKTLALRPRCVISYNRMPFVGSRYDFGLRVTFDTQLKYRMNELDVTSKCKNSYFLPPDYVVMEVKANEKVPVWLMSFLSAHQCNLQRISKYCTGIQKGFYKFRNNKITNNWMGCE